MFFIFTLFCVKNPVNVGLTMPGTVANVLDMPIKTLAYCGATSKWFTLCNRLMFIERL